METKKALIVAAVGGFLHNFEMNDVLLLKELGYEIHYASDFQVDIYDFERSELEKMGIILHQVEFSKNPLAFGTIIRSYRRLKEIIDRNQISLLHCHNPISGAIARFSAARSRRKPYVIYTAHGFHFYEGAPAVNRLIYQNVEKYLEKYTDICITINAEDEANAVKVLGYESEKVYKIPGVGVDMTRFRENSEIRNDMRRELGIPEQAFHLVSSGELNRNKNHQVVIKALERLKEEDVFYTICGNDSVNGTEGELRALIEQAGLSSKVHLAGFRKDIENVLAAADLFVFPSLREGLGMAAVEALASGVPVVCTENRGTREYIRHRENGLFCENNAESFAEAVREMKNNSELYKHCRENCHSTAAMFSSEETGKIMTKIYEKADKEAVKRFL